MNFKIYYRKSLMEKSELDAAAKYFDTCSLLTDIQEKELVIPRYSLFPFPLDQEKEVLNIGAKFINTYGQHRYVADLQNYVAGLKELTPLTWDNLQYLPENTSFVVKGETNSRKGHWDREMFASNKSEAGRIYSLLSADGLIAQQKIYIREYIPLETYFKGIGGIPVTKEFRFFCCFGKVLCGDFYWQNYVDDLPEKPDANEVPKEFLQKVLDRIDGQINFVVIDVAKTQAGDWIVVELNDGCCSGLSCNDPEILYSKLYNCLEEKYNVHL